MIKIGRSTMEADIVQRRTIYFIEQFKRHECQKEEFAKNAENAEPANYFVNMGLVHIAF